MELADDLPLVMADRRRIVQVLSNLLSNAASYSPDGLPIVVSAEREGVYVEVSVTDEGRGFSAELLPELFRKFSRASGPATTSGIDGSGLGLAVCKGIVEAHGGRISAESEGPGWARASPSRCRRWRAHPLLPLGPHAASDRHLAAKCASSRWTTTRRTCDTSERCLSGRDTLPS